MKVCFVIQKLAGLSGGAERILIEVSAAMAARGMSVQILTFERNTVPAHYPLGDVKHKNLMPKRLQSQQGAKTGQATGRSEKLLKRIPNLWPLPHLKWFLTYGQFISRLQAQFSADRPDIVIGFMPTGIMVSAIAAKGTGIPVIGSIHNVPKQDYDEITRWDTNPVYRQRRLEALHDIEQILVLQPDFKQWFDPALHHKIAVMPNPVVQATQKLPPMESRSKTILGVGRLTKIKRYDLLLQAWSKIAKKHPDWALRIFGAGPEKVALADLVEQLKIADQTTLAGVTSQILDELRDASILCHPAEFEGFGLSVAEALAHKVPVVASADCTGISMLVDNNKSGLLVAETPDFVAALATALDTLIQSEPLRKRLGDAGESAMKHFTPERVFAQWEQLLRETVRADGK